MHISIMVKNSGLLQIEPGEQGFDATLGYGGHTRAMLECLKRTGTYLGDRCGPGGVRQDEKRLEDLGFRGRDLLTVRLQNFCTIDEIAKEVGGFDFYSGGSWRVVHADRQSEARLLV